MYSYAQRSSHHIGVPRWRRVGVLHVGGNTNCVWAVKTRGWANIPQMGECDIVDEKLCKPLCLNKDDVTWRRFLISNTTSSVLTLSSRRAYIYARPLRRGVTLWNDTRYEWWLCCYTTRHSLYTLRWYQFNCFARARERLGRPHGNDEGNDLGKTRRTKFLCSAFESYTNIPLGVTYY